MEHLQDGALAGWSTCSMEHLQYGARYRVTPYTVTCIASMLEENRYTKLKWIKSRFENLYFEHSSILVKHVTNSSPLNQLFSSPASASNPDVSLERMKIQGKSKLQTMKEWHERERESSSRSIASRIWLMMDVCYIMDHFIIYVLYWPLQ